MNVKTHRPGINEATLMSRHVRLAGLDAGKAALIVSKIDKIAGIDSVSVNEDRCVLNLAYDAARVNICQIEEIIQQCGCAISHDLWTQFKKSCYRFFDDNVKANVNHQPSCCNKPPRK